jgi:hypothetical protein
LSLENIARAAFGNDALEGVICPEIDRSNNAFDLIVGPDLFSQR